MHPPRNPSIRMQDTLADSRVDLRLAVSYVPACICFFKACVLLCVLSALHAAHFFNGCYVAVGLALVLDRLHEPVAIFDSNGVLLSLFLAHLVNHVRETLQHTGSYTLHSLVLFCVWPLSALMALFECPLPFVRKRWLLGSFCETACFISLVAFVIIEPEAYLVRIVRGLLFVMLSFAWVYIIGIHQRRLIHSVDSAVHFAVYFSPVLYVHSFIALTYGGVVILSLVVLMRRDLLQTTPQGSSSSVTALCCERESLNLKLVPKSDPLTSSDYDSGLLEMEEAFRQAKALRETLQQAGGGGFKAS